MHPHVTKKFNKLSVAEHKSVMFDEPVFNKQL